MLAQVVIYYPCALQNLYFQKMNVIPVSLHFLPKEAHTFWLSEVASNLFTMTHYSLWWNRNITLYLSMFWWWLYFSSLQKWKTVPYMQCGRGHQRWYVCLLNWKIGSIKACSVLKKSVRLIQFLFYMKNRWDCIWKEITRLHRRSWTLFFFDTVLCTQHGQSWTWYEMKNDLVLRNWSL